MTEIRVNDTRYSRRKIQTFKGTRMTFLGVHQSSPGYDKMCVSIYIYIYIYIHAYGLYIYFFVLV